MAITPIEIKVDKFFWMLKPWKDGQLAAIDGWGRFSTITFEKKDKASVKHLINFPRKQINGVLRTWPEANLLWTMTESMMHVADVALKKSKSFIPLFCTGMKRMPVLIDADAGVILFQYAEATGPWDKPTPLVPQVYYNYKTDTILSIEEKGVVHIIWPVGADWYFCRDLTNPDAREFNLQNIKTKEISRNALARVLDELKMPPESLDGYDGLCFARRYIMGESQSRDPLHADVKITWDEDYEDVSILPLDYLTGLIQPAPPVTPSHFSSSFTHSADGGWVTSSYRGYQGLYGERLRKQVFFHMDNRYPGGISPPVVSTEYLEDGIIPGEFVNHPEYGMCYAQEHHSGKDISLLLYKMSDVLAEINRRLLETAGEALGN